jgi:peptidyl-prolyl cis-trans isomerase-like protein 2
MPVPCHSVQDPFEDYRKRLAAKLAKHDTSEAALAARAEKRAKRENDRTTWLGTNLGEKGQKRPREEDVGGVGKYLAASAKPPTTEADIPASSSFGVEAKKQKKLGSFGNFSNW